MAVLRGAFYEGEMASLNNDPLDYIRDFELFNQIKEKS
jgi:hypothetical protein